MRQETLTVAARVAGSPPFTELRRALAALAAQVRAPRGTPSPVFADPSLGIHFARLVLVEEPPQSELASWLVFESNFDTAISDPSEARRAHLELLSQSSGEALDSVFRYCVEFGTARGAMDLASALLKSLVAASAAYQGHTYRDLKRIRLERHLREVLLDYFSRAPEAPLRELYRSAREHVRLQSALDPELAGLDIDQPAPALPDPAMRAARLQAGLGAWFKNLSMSLLGYALRELPRIAAWQKSDLEFDDRAEQEAWSVADRNRWLEIAETEDYALQNALTHVVSLKGSERLAVLLASHGYIDLMAKNHFNDIGQLGGIPTIHFAKWLLLDDDRRLLFLSNYDSSWESYLGDFVDRAAIGLNLAWTCTDRYPKTFLLALLGATDEERFKAWSRAHQRPTQVFYSAYPDLGIAALNNNTWIRHGLHHPPSALDLANWFRRLT